MLEEAKKFLFYNEEGTRASRTAMMSMTFFMLSVVTWIAMGVTVMYLLLNEKEINVGAIAAYLGFVSTITGGGFLQYSWGKKEQRKKIKDERI